MPASSIPAREKGTDRVFAAKILLVEDDTQRRRALRKTLTSSGYIVVEARTRGEASEEFRAEGDIDLVIVDLARGADALEVSRTVRGISTAPIVLLSGRRSRTEKVEALEAGVDDYLIRPVAIRELLLRLRALRRRVSGSPVSRPFESAGLKIEFERRRVSIRDRVIHLGPLEFDLLCYLIRHEGEPVRHQALLDSVWGQEHSEDIDRLRVTINTLRRKIELNPRRMRYIHTVHRFGYRFEAKPQLSDRRARA